MTIPTPGGPDRLTSPNRSADPDRGGGHAATAPQQWRQAHRLLRRLDRRLGAAADTARTRGDIAALVEQVLQLRAHQPILVAAPGMRGRSPERAAATRRVLCGAHHAAPTAWPCPLVRELRHAAEREIPAPTPPHPTSPDSDSTAGDATDQRGTRGRVRHSLSSTTTTAAA